MKDLPERIEWAIGVLDVQPADVILEIGCGTGLAIGPVCSRLNDGHLTAIDRSASQIEKALTANPEAIASGKADIILTEFLEADLPARHFDKIFLFNINVFWMDPKAELAEINRLLDPDGKFFLFHQPPPGNDVEEFAEAFRNNLVKYGFEIDGTYFSKPERAVDTLCLISRSK